MKTISKMKKEELIEAILEESQIHHNISISFNRLNSTDEIDEDPSYPLTSSVAEFLVDAFKADWEANFNGEIWTCGRGGATIYWDSYWDESNFKYRDYDLQEDDWDKESLTIMLKDIRNFNIAVEGLMEDFYANVNDGISRLTEEKEKQDKEDKLYDKTLKLIKKNDFTKRLFYDLIYKDL